MSDLTRHQKSAEEVQRAAENTPGNHAAEHSKLTAEDRSKQEQLAEARRLHGRAPAEQPRPLDLSEQIRQQREQRAQAAQADKEAHPERQANRIGELADKAVKGDAKAKRELERELQGLSGEKSEYKEAVLKQLEKDGARIGGKDDAPHAVIKRDAAGNPEEINFSYVFGLKGSETVGMKAPAEKPVTPPEKGEFMGEYTPGSIERANREWQDPSLAGRPTPQKDTTK